MSPRKINARPRFVRLGIRERRINDEEASRRDVNRRSNWSVQNLVTVFYFGTSKTLSVAASNPETLGIGSIFLLPVIVGRK